MATRLNDRSPPPRGRESDVSPEDQYEYDNLHELADEPEGLLEWAGGVLRQFEFRIRQWRRLDRVATAMRRSSHNSANRPKRP